MSTSMAALHGQLYALEKLFMELAKNLPKDEAARLRHYVDSEIKTSGIEHYTDGTPPEFVEAAAKVMERAKAVLR